MAKKTKKVKETKKIEDIKTADENLQELLEARKADIRVIGIGGAGGNTVSRMVQVGIAGVQLIAANTDAQDLLYTDADKKLLLGQGVTRGLGAGSDPELGVEAAKESRDEIKKALQGADMVFITCGLGGGTGTGAAPIIAEIAKKVGALTVAVVTTPFKMEGKERETNAESGLEKLGSVVDTLIVIPNDKLLEIVPDVGLITSFKVADEILVNAVKGIVELVTKPGLVNLDFADVRAVMSRGQLAMIGLGESDTENRAAEAAEKALSNPLLDVEIDGSTGSLINVTGGPEMTIKEAQRIVETVSSRLDPNAKIIWGAQIDEHLGDTIRAMVIVTGVKGKKYEVAMPSPEKRKEIEKILGIDFVS